MKLSSYLNTDFIFTVLKSDNKDDIIKELVDKAAKKDPYLGKMKDQIEEAVLKREHEMSTAMGRGISIPHARIEDYDDVNVIIGISRSGIACELATGKNCDTVKLFFMIVTGKTKNKVTLKLMSSIMKLAANEEVVEQIATEMSPEKILKIIDDSNIEVENRITAQDIMVDEIKPARLSDTLEEIASRFVVEDLRGIPVIDDNGNFIGEITQRELISYGMPQYTSLMNDMSFMTVGEPFEEYFKKEKEVTVKELYRSIEKVEIVDRKASIMEVSFLMVTKGNTRIYVVEDNKFYGMILRSDIIKKVLHI